jgi:hypothetical protein
MVFLKTVIGRYFPRMLSEAVLLPSALDSSSVDLQCRPLFCSIALNVLIDLQDRGVVLVDDQNRVTKDLVDRVRDWPEKFRKRALELIAHLKRNGRFAVSSGYPVNVGSCTQQSCKECLGIAMSGRPDCVMCSDRCLSRVRNDLSSRSAIEVIDITQYPLSRLCKAYRANSSLVLVDGQWDEQRFESRVLVPLFKHAKHVKIIDRYIGRSITIENCVI